MIRIRKHISDSTAIRRTTWLLVMTLSVLATTPAWSSGPQDEKRAQANNRAGSDRQMNLELNERLSELQDRLADLQQDLTELSALLERVQDRYDRHGGKKGPRLGRRERPVPLPSIPVMPTAPVVTLPPPMPPVPPMPSFNEIREGTPAERLKRYRKRLDRWEETWRKEFDPWLEQYKQWGERQAEMGERMRRRQAETIDRWREDLNRSQPTQRKRSHRHTNEAEGRHRDEQQHRGSANAPQQSDTDRSTPTGGHPRGDAHRDSQKRPSANKRVVYNVKEKYADWLYELLAPSTVKMKVSHAEKGIVVRGSKSEHAALNAGLQLLNWIDRDQVFDDMREGEQVERVYRLGKKRAEMLYDMLAPNEVRVVVAPAGREAVSVLGTQGEHEVLSNFLKVLHWKLKNR